jgi:hypothetical protein
MRTVREARKGGGDRKEGQKGKTEKEDRKGGKKGMTEREDI